MAQIFKCYSELDTPERMFFLNSIQIKKITSKTMQDGRNKLFITYSDMFRDETLLICEEIVTIDTNIDEDYKIWLNS